MPAWGCTGVTCFEADARERPLRVEKSLFWQYHLGRKLQTTGTTHEPAVIETHELAACRAARPMERVSKVEPAPMQNDRVVDSLPPLHGDMSHSQQMRSGITKGGRLGFVESAHHPLKLENDG